MGEATLFPNLFPLSEFHAVCAISHAHYLPLQDFTSTILSDGIQTCLEFIRSASSSRSSLKYATINCNYLFPAGASAVHPHMQVVGGDVPYTFLAQMLDGSQRYFTQFHSIYWNDLIAAERALGERYIGHTGNVEWVATFAPLGVNEIQGILCNTHNFLEVSQADVLALGEGLSRILMFYAENGYSTFNLAIYSGPLDATEEQFWTNVRIISRSNVYENYRASEYFLQKLLGTEVLITSPENLAMQLKSKF
jgi:galactose-1-phosphate uridylyltransferase